MLVLSRKVGEGIQLGDDITVTLVKISGNMVRLGIEAPPHMPVARQELVARLIEASHADPSKHEPADPQAAG
jgi:carbon storage regulator